MSISTSPTPDPRVSLAAERTLLAWIRTGIALMGFGFVVARFGLFLQELAIVTTPAVPPRGHASVMGVALVGGGLLVNGWASIRYSRLIKALQRGQSINPSARGPVSVGMATVVGGVVLLAILMAAMVK